VSFAGVTLNVASQRVFIVVVVVVVVVVYFVIDSVRKVLDTLAYSYLHPSNLIPIPVLHFNKLNVLDFVLGAYETVKAAIIV
jgi:hypothetical protein